MIDKTLIQFWIENVCKNGYCLQASELENAHIWGFSLTTESKNKYK